MLQVCFATVHICVKDIKINKTNEDAKQNTY